jgi:hypothetical protein
MATTKSDLYQITKEAKKDDYRVNSDGNLQKGNSIISIAPSGGSVKFNDGRTVTSLSDFKKAL